MHGIYIKDGVININILQFGEKIIDRCLTNNHHIEEIAIEKQKPWRKGLHILHPYKGSARKSRKRCKECYKCLHKKEVEIMPRRKLKE